MLIKPALLLPCLLGLFLSAQASAISDDANPWLAIENAVCVSHRGVDYSSQVNAKVQLSEVQWRGASDGLSMHCYLSGIINAQTFIIRLPTDWNQQLYDRARGSRGDDEAALSEALNQGYAVLFSTPSEAGQSLLLATVDHQYRKLVGAD